MTKGAVAMLPPGEAAHFLRGKLGNIVSFDDLLSDARKGRPLYRLKDLEAFVADAKAMGIDSDPGKLGIVWITLH